MAKEEEEEAERSVGAYFRLLRDYPGWRILWIGEILSNTGNWFNYVATLLVVERLAGGRGIFLSIVLVIHFLPSFIWFPVAGVVADRYDRTNVIIYSGLVSAAAVLLLPLVQYPSQLWLMYLLLIVSFSTSAFYDPARRALAPSLVPRKTLHLATTLDSFAWSLTGAFGSSIGGLAASKFGTSTCFYLDAVTYLLAALCAYRLKVMIRNDNVGQPLKQPIAAKASSPLPDSISMKPESEIPHSELPRQALSTGLLHGTESNREESASDHDSGNEEESAALLGNGKAGSETSHLAETAPQGCFALLLWGLRDEFAALKEGWDYACARSNRDVLGYTLIKASGTLVWGAGDIVNVRFSELPQMQGWGDAAFTLGLIFASVGLSCFIGPIFFNCITPPKPPQLLLSSAVCFIFIFSGYLGLALSQEIIGACLSTMLRSFGSSVLWVYSTLLLQLRVPDGLLGRMLALEVAFFTIAESASVLAGGIALDNLGVTLRQLCVIEAGIGVLMVLVWLPFAIIRFRQSKRSVIQPAIEL